MADVTAKDIEKLVANALEAPTQKAKRDGLKNIIENINQVAKEIQEDHQNLMFYNSEIDRIQSQGMSRKSAIHYAYTIEKVDFNIKLAQENLQQKALEGYEIVNKIRQKFTKQVISYQIGVGSKKREFLIQTKMSYDELVPNLYLEKRSDGYSIRIKLSQRKMKELSKKREQEGKKAINDVEVFTAGGSTLYSAVYRYFTNEKLRQKGNWGNFYQVYQYLLAKSPKKNKYHPSNSVIANAFSKVLGGGGKGGSFAAGGDVGTSQDKASFGSNPTLTTVNTITNQLLDLSNNLQIFLTTGSQQGLIQMLTRENLGIKTIDVARDQAIRSIRQVLSQFKNYQE